jgi:hypothetical protein
LARGVPRAALADRHFLGARREREDLLADQRVVQHDVGLAEQPRRSQRQQIGGARAGADQVDRAAHAGRRRKSGTGRVTDAW